MNRGERRRIERQLRSIMKGSDDKCSLCGAPFPHNSKTFGGVTKNSAVALAGECCARKISEVVTTGVFVDRPYDGLLTPRDTSRSVPTTSAGVSDAVKRLQDRVAKADELEHDIAKRAGVSSRSASVNLSDSAWKSDDAAWFVRNTQRSHRLRALFPGEAATLGANLSKAAPPPGHEFQVLVRQIDVGKRMRLLFCRNLATPIPDIDEVLHALFDIVASRHREGDVVSVGEVAELARRYVPPPGKS